MTKLEISICALAVVCITALEGFALYQGVNGTALSASFAAVGGVVGYAVGTSKKKGTPK